MSGGVEGSRGAIPVTPSDLKNTSNYLSDYFLNKELLNGLAELINQVRR